MHVNTYVYMCVCVYFGIVGKQNLQNFHMQSFLLPLFTGVFAQTSVCEDVYIDEGGNKYIYLYTC